MFKHKKKTKLDVYIQYGRMKTQLAEIDVVVVAETSVHFTALLWYILE